MNDEIERGPSEPHPEVDVDHPADRKYAPHVEASHSSQDVVGLGQESLLPFQDLIAPAPLTSAPPLQARWLALISTLVAGLLGGLVGYGIGDLIGKTPVWSAIGGAIGAITAAGGVGLVVNLTLRAMNEWKVVQHPEKHPEKQQEEQ